MPADERCGSNETNSLDVDIGAYRTLTAGMMNGGVEWDAVSFFPLLFVCVKERVHSLMIEVGCRVNRI